MPITVDDSTWPILRVEASGDASDADVDSYLQVIDHKMIRREAHVIIADARRANSLKGTHRKQLADYNKQHAADLSKYRKGFALVSEKALVRGLMTAVYWMFPPPFPHASFKTEAEAERWANEQLRRGRAA